MFQNKIFQMKQTSLLLLSNSKLTAQSETANTLNSAESMPLLIAARKVLLVTVKSAKKKSA